MKMFMLPRKYRGFIDSVKVLVAGGAGGMGAPKYGGLGGRGGNVILETKEGVALHELMFAYKKKEIRAESGGDSGPTQILGKIGVNKIVEVPQGLIVRDEHNQVIGELNESGVQLVVARGGIGGCPESGYSGTSGQKRIVQLDLKLIADIGLVGFPNAGKSTLLKAITRANPKIASYPFTTIRPNVGSIIYEDLRNISIADLPGLIEGAHRNIGMGHQFLRHCERTKLLLLVVDIQGFQLNRKYDYRTCLETIVLLNKEIELYRENLLDKPAMLVVNKMDTEGAWDTFKSIEKSLDSMQDVLLEFPEEIRPFKPIKFDQVIPMSVKYQPSDVVDLKYTIRKFLDIYAEENLVDAEKNLISELRQQLLETGPKYA